MYVLTFDVFYVEEMMEKWGCSWVKVDMTNEKQVQRNMCVSSYFCTFTLMLELKVRLELEKAKTSGNERVVLWMETPSNPLCKVVDIACLIKLAKGKRCNQSSY